MKKGHAHIYIGYDINDSYAQISHMTAGSDEPLTASVVLGAEQFDIPVALRRRSGGAVWLYGKEALKADEGDDPVVTRLLDAAVRDTLLDVGDEQIDPISLLAIFIRRSLSLLTIQVNKGDIAALMFTTPTITPRIAQVFAQVAADLDMPPERVFIQSHSESMYQYIIHQPPELWRHQVLLFDFSSHLKSFQMVSNKRTTPTVVFIEGADHPALMYTAAPSERQKKEWDRLFLTVAEEATAGRMISSVYLVGEGFKEEWAQESLRHLCRGCRVFRGNNLYSKGACYGAMEKDAPSEVGRSMVFLGDEKLKANVGIRLMRRGEEAYFAILDAGKNWHECKNSFEIILGDEQRLALVITSLTGAVVTKRPFDLPGLPARPPRCTRLRLDISLESADTARLAVTDLGFGDFYPATGREWVFEIALSATKESP